MMHIVRLPSWGLTLPTRADYYGYRWGIHFGRHLVFIGKARVGRLLDGVTHDAFPGVR